ncbi:MAG: hypothetical protein DHS20C21_02280 [Gemmatimonadota bacterium]|nr:MAG: hypothetical protein DHS20C21_02280 [Gemmatimonadota bacterium]
MSSAGASIVKYTDEVWPETDRFWTTVLGPDWNDEARSRWRWMNARRSHFLSVQEGRVLGNATLLRQPFVTPTGEKLDVGWITDFYVSTELKGQGIGKRLARRLEEDVEVVATFGQSDEARHCFHSVGWTGLDWTPLLGVTLPGLRRHDVDTRAFTRIPLDSPAFDEVWNRRGATSLCVGARDTAALGERLLGRPDANYEAWTTDSGDGIQGWVLLRMIRGGRNRRFGRVPTGLIVDLLAVDGADDVLARLASFGAWRLGRLGAVMVLAVDTASPTGESLSRAGFRPSLGVGPLRVRRLPQKGFMQSRATPPFHLTFLDCDAELTF